MDSISTRNVGNFAYRIIGQLHFYGQIFIEKRVSKDSSISAPYQLNPLTTRRQIAQILVQTLSYPAELEQRVLFPWKRRAETGPGASTGTLPSLGMSS